MRQHENSSLNPKFCILNSRKGYTLIEMLVVIAVTAILTGMVLVYNRSGEKQIILHRDEARVVGVINRAKSLALQNFRDPTLSGYDFCAFGVHFDPSPSKEFILFQDLGEGGCALGRAYAYDSASDPSEEIEKFFLDPSLEFVNINDPIDVLFVPPELSATTTNPSGFPVTVNLRIADGDTTASITISSAGQIVQ